MPSEGLHICTVIPLLSPHLTTTINPPSTEDHWYGPWTSILTTLFRTWLYCYTSAPHPWGQWEPHLWLSTLGSWHPFAEKADQAADRRRLQQNRSVLDWCSRSSSKKMMGGIWSHGITSLPFHLFAAMWKYFFRGIVKDKTTGTVPTKSGGTSDAVLGLVGSTRRS